MKPVTGPETPAATIERQHAQIASLRSEISRLEAALYDALTELARVKDEAAFVKDFTKYIRE